MVDVKTFGKPILLLLGLVFLVVITTLALSAATLGTSIRRFNQLIKTESKPDLKSVLAETVRIDDLMNHLRQLQRIADESNSTRAIDTVGFTRTIDYIVNYLREQIPEYEIYREPFEVRRFAVTKHPNLTALINGVEVPFVYSPSLVLSDFETVIYSGPADFTEFVPLVVVNNTGCSKADWKFAEDRVALVRAGGTCTYAEKGILAGKFRAKAVLFYNTGATGATLPPASVRIRLANKLPALSLSHKTGQSLVSASLQGEVKIKLRIELDNLGSFTVENICADTPQGQNDKIIVVGSHTDSVPAGPGINDNGSGTSANLVLATNLARLYRTSSYKPYAYKVRFCWWAAEEIGLAGSSYHVENARTSTEAGRRLQDYLLNLNFDMAASPNFIFGIYDAKTAPSETPNSARAGSQRITDLYRDWLIEQNLPYDFRDFNGRSDYGPFLAAGLVAGGVATGSDASKTMSQREKYNRLVGQENAGFAGAILDPCYHLLCDNIDNIQKFGYERLVQAAAFGLEYLGQHPDLVSWIYPDGRPQTFE